jgi:GDP-L-fucose synthase
LNIGSGSDLSIKELALLVKKVIGFEGELKFNTDKPDGTPRKLMDITKIKSLGWAPSIALEEGISLAYSDFLLGKNKI